MSQENVEAVRRLVRTFNEGDVEALVAELDSEVEWEEQLIPGVEPVYRGHDGVRRWAQLILGEELVPLQGRIEGLTEAGDTVIVAARFEAEGKRSGVPVELAVHLVFTFKQGKVVRRQVFQTRGEALEAVGLRE
jgi:ketosteroid isomerase-like protein